MMAGKKNIHRGDAETLRKEKTNAKPESAEVAENRDARVSVLTVLGGFRLTRR